MGHIKRIQSNQPEMQGSFSDDLQNKDTGSLDQKGKANDNQPTRKALEMQVRTLFSAVLSWKKSKHDSNFTWSTLTGIVNH
jgi:hypothetical protein